MQYEQLELPFVEPDIQDDYEQEAAAFLDEPAYDWRTQAEAAEEERDELREAIAEAHTLIGRAILAHINGFSGIMTAALDQARSVLADAGK